jgi:hypothetical protein
MKHSRNLAIFIEKCLPRYDKSGIIILQSLGKPMLLGLYARTQSIERTGLELALG